MSDVTTTAGERFTQAEHAEMAWLIFKRFGRDDEAAAAAWRRMMQNGCAVADFMQLVDQGAAAKGEPRAEVLGH